MTAVGRFIKFHMQELGNQEESKIELTGIKSKYGSVRKCARQSNSRKQYLTSLWMTGSPEEEQQHTANDKKRADSNDCQR